MSDTSPAIHPIPDPRPMAWPRTPVNLETIGYSAQNVRDRRGAAFTQRAVFPHLGDELLLCVTNSMTPEEVFDGGGTPIWSHPSAFCHVDFRIHTDSTEYTISAGQRGDVDSIGAKPLTYMCRWDRLALLFQQDHFHVIATLPYLPLLPHQVHDAAPRPVRAFELALDHDDIIVRSARAGVFAGARLTIKVHIARQPERMHGVPPALGSGRPNPDRDEAW